MTTWRVLTGDCRESMAAMSAESFHCCVTSPPYWGLRDYGHEGQLGLESTPEEYVARLVDVFREVRRVLRPDGTLWLNLGDCYSANRGYQVPDGKVGDVGNSRGMKSDDVGLQPKNLVGIPWRVAFALQADGWYLRSDIIWAKPNPMPESVTDRPTKSHEYVFLMSKSERYNYDADAISESLAPGSAERYAYAFGGKKNEALVSANEDGVGQRTRPVGRREAGGKHAETDPNAGGRRMTGSVATARENGAPHDAPFGPTRNRRSVWTIPTHSFPEAHFATFPELLVEPCILAGCPEGGMALDPFSGSGTVGVVAVKRGRSFVGCELNPEYVEMARRRIGAANPLFAKEDITFLPDGKL